MDMKEHRRVSPEGKKLGALLVQLTEKSIAKLVAEGEIDERCLTCAFRQGTVPNGCIQTQLDALKAVSEKIPFMCHHKQPRNTHVCHGWYACAVATKDAPAKEAPWPFSPDDS